MVKRLIDCTKSDFEKMKAPELKIAIYKSEGRVIMAQHLVMVGEGIIKGVTNAEIEAAFGADMILLNTYHPNGENGNPGLQGMTLMELKKLINRPIGVYLGCTGKGKELPKSLGPAATPENIKLCLEQGADFIVLGGNPGSGTSIDAIIEATKMAKEIIRDKALLFAGKWEDGVEEKVLGDPLAKRPAKEVIKELIDAGADVINFPAPGSRHGISVNMIRECVEFVHSYKPGTLAMTFLDSSVESADVDTIRHIALKMKETGADIHAIGDGGYAGCTLPENIYQLSLTIRGRRFTIKRMAANNR
ncbi:conserved hypothetical protein [Thermoanaerobacter mathranii subsp. mathranii str. A3]|uniref:DUF7916 domain-containing protein n=1 Tax=Thermoanaerobacter mathranii subsp. mathranii (strain DSM 11426 / CCUG 53645 / CIP 108742 / A3) TaxID=583358 RepID=A0ABM5LP09_THEM3|nr:hypothetical protein [Thermoanaerobacter mathranii]ADH60416.1 conserved hypothetical protein [Thermoanaerobacter mathranii subsp. mathranii str. A3]